MCFGEGPSLARPGDWRARRMPRDREASDHGRLAALREWRVAATALFLGEGMNRWGTGQDGSGGRLVQKIIAN